MTSHSLNNHRPLSAPSNNTKTDPQLTTPPLPSRPLTAHGRILPPPLAPQ